MRILIEKDSSSKIEKTCTPEEAMAYESNGFVVIVLEADEPAAAEEKPVEPEVPAG